MRLIKMLGLAAVAAMAAMAFVGATSASATSTQLCTAHTALTCSSGASEVGMLNVTSDNEDVEDAPPRLLSDLLDVICDHVHGSATALALASPQVLHASVNFLSCETDGGDGCTVTAASNLANLLKTGLDAGTLTATGGTSLVFCEDVFFTVDIHCVYDATGLQFAVGAQHLTANNTRVDILPEESSLCPEESFLDGLLATTANRYVLA